MNISKTRMPSRSEPRVALAGALLLVAFANGLGACGDDNKSSGNDVELHDGSVTDGAINPTSHDAGALMDGSDGSLRDADTTQSGPDGSDTQMDGSVDDGGATDTGDAGESDGSVPDGSVPDGSSTSSVPHAVGGSVAGLAAGATLILRNNGADDLTITADGTFAFATKLADGAAYSVVAYQQPSYPSQTCTVSGGSGQINASDVSTVQVTCTTKSFSVSGAVTGLSGSVTLQDNGGDDLVVSADGTFVFATPVPSGAAYSVAVKTQPSGGSCTVTGGAGTVGAADVQSVTVNCSNNRYTVGGSISGLAGGTLVLDNGGEQRTLTANGTFAFANTFLNGTQYDVTVVSQPANQTCTIQNGAGSVGTSNVTDVQVTCAVNLYHIGGTLSGLPSGTTITLQNQGGDDLSLSASGSFAFATLAASGSTYGVTVKTQPVGTICSVSGATGTVGSGDVSSIVVNCSANSHTVGGTVFGLTGNLVLQNNAADNLTLTANGSFAFSTPVLAGSAYDVTVQHQPTGQTCQVANGSGTMGTSDVASVVVTCVTKTYKLGGSISGLTGTVTLGNNGHNFLTQNADGTFTFSGLVASGSAYDVTVMQQPAGQFCTVSDGAGTVGSADVTDISVTCVSGVHSIGGLVSGLAGTPVVLQDNGGNDLSVGVNGRFTFKAGVATGAMYKVTVLTAPTGRTCQVTNGSGTVGTNDVVNVLVVCQLIL